MKYHETDNYSFLLGNNHYVYDHKEDENSLILGVAMFLSNVGASKVLALLGVKVSNNTIQRLYDRIEFIDHPDVEEIGIDDVAIWKGQTYATAVYDLKDYHLIALLEGRDAETLMEWLKSHQKIRLAARDRASAYATAINTVLPDCVQVADRFHLLQNLFEYLKDIFNAEMPSSIYIKDSEILDQEPDKKYLATLCYDNTPPTNPDGSQQLYDNKNHYLSRPYLRQWRDVDFCHCVFEREEKRVEKCGGLRSGDQCTDFCDRADESVSSWHKRFSDCKWGYLAGT